jgi:hypothetical protein
VTLIAQVADTQNDGKTVRQFGKGKIPQKAFIAAILDRDLPIIPKPIPLL